MTFLPKIRYLLIEVVFLNTKGTMSYTPLSFLIDYKITKNDIFAHESPKSDNVQIFTDISGVVEHKGDSVLYTFALFS